MHYKLPVDPSAKRFPARRASAVRTCLVATAVSKLHASVIMGRLKHLGVEQECISALALPGMIPGGLTGRDEEAHANFPRDAGDSIDVSGSLASRLSIHPGKSLEQCLVEEGLGEIQVSLVSSAIEADRVTLWIDVRQREDRDGILDVLEANGVTDMFALQLVESRPAVLRFPSAHSFVPETRLVATG